MRASALLAVALFGLGLPAVATAQGRLTVDESMADRGKTLWSKRGCNGCHVLGKRTAGPDLLGVNERRDHAWLLHWLQKTDEVLASDDSLAHALLVEYKNVKMPNMKLTEADATALLHYIQKETDKKKS
jgi:cytochrome c551/c552